jgi:hypothetical protein
MFIHIGGEAEGIDLFTWHRMAFRIDIGMRKYGMEGSRCI